ncbi:hypothetical protein ABC347_04415 [Sphingomonas sp. 1P06PA]|uniref:hypothetical protein n=1 Tax=Sphingomonas sp. 1P06PA TaxID=554121 RepID=UPI0039A62E99
MKISALIAATALGLVATPLIAQPSVPDNGPTDPREELPYDRGYDKPSSRADAINSREAPVTARLNRNAAVNNQPNAPLDAEAQYEADREAYADALAANDAQRRRGDRRYARQQAAYAQAMADWRLQVIDCEDGVRAACDAPTPDPRDYF